MRILILMLEIEEHISSNLEFCYQFKLFFLNWVQLFSTWAFSTNFELKLSTSSKWEYKFSISERHNFLCVRLKFEKKLELNLYNSSNIP